MQISFQGQYGNPLTVDSAAIPLSKETKTAVAELHKFCQRMTALVEKGEKLKGKAAASGDVEGLLQDYAATKYELDLVEARKAFLENQTLVNLRTDETAAEQAARKRLAERSEKLRHARIDWNDTMATALGGAEAERARTYGVKPKSIVALEKEFIDCEQLTSNLQQLGFWIQSDANCREVLRLLAAAS